MPPTCDPGGEPELTWSQVGDDEVMACQAEMVRRCRELGGKAAEFGEILGQISDVRTIRRAMAFIEANGE
jgi:hypothetical protein